MSPQLRRICCRAKITLIVYEEGGHNEMEPAAARLVRNSDGLATFVPRGQCTGRNCS